LRVRLALKAFVYFLLGTFAVMGVLYGVIASSEGERAADYAFFKQIEASLPAAARPLVIAHRGGAGLAPENTMQAFERARSLGVDVIELDVRSTADGALVVFHDSAVDRTTNGSGRIGEMTLDEVKKLDAGYRFTPDGGASFPFRERGVAVPTLQEVFTAFPEMRFNIEPKPGVSSLAQPLCRMIRENNLTDRVVVGSFSQTTLDEFRRECAEIATSAGPSEVTKFLTMYKTGLSQAYSPAMQALQVPDNTGLLAVTKEFVAAAHERNLKVHVWTVNNTAAMERLVEAGVDGIMTDFPDRLLDLLNKRSGAAGSDPRRE
jgi:glycerophosphoryl diester phosphodiesterase